MHRIILLYLTLFLSAPAGAQSDHSAEFRVEGFNDFIGMELDFDLGTAYIAATGAMISGDEDGNYRILIFGACMLERTETGENALTCSLDLGGQPLLLAVNIDEGVGGLTDFNGDEIDAAVTITRVR